MVDRSHVGLSAECPHCFGTIEVPESLAVNKERLLEPPGLRRILKEVRDQEWERLRRKLNAAKARISELEKATTEARSALARKEKMEPPVGEVENLRRQVADMSEKFVQANQAFTAGRKQHDLALENLRRELDASREEAADLKSRNVAATGAAVAASAELEKLREEAEAAKSKANASNVELHQSASNSTQSSVGEVGTQNDRPTPPLKDSTEEPAEPIDETMSSELDVYFVELLKNNASLLSENDRMRQEIDRVHAELLSHQVSERTLEDAVQELESGIKEVVWTIATRRERSNRG